MTISHSNLDFFHCDSDCVCACTCAYHFQSNDEVSQHARSSGASAHGKDFTNAQSVDFHDVVSLYDI